MEPSGWLILVGVAIVAYLFYDWVRHYLSQCPKCKGTGKVYSKNWEGQYRPCPRCKRKGEVSHSFGPKG